MKEIVSIIIVALLLKLSFMYYAKHSDSSKESMKKYCETLPFGCAYNPKMKDKVVKKDIIKENILRTLECAAYQESFIDEREPITRENISNLLKESSNKYIAKIVMTKHELILYQENNQVNNYNFKESKLYGNNMFDEYFSIKDKKTNIYISQDKAINNKYLFAIYHPLKLKNVVEDTTNKFMTKYECFILKEEVQ